MNHNDMIAVIAAHRDGKKIECKYSHKEHDKWVPVEFPPSWDFGTYDYRIAVEPRWCWVRWGKDGEFRYTTDSLIAATTSDWQLVVEEIK